MTIRRSLTAIGLVAAVGVSSATWAQQATTPKRKTGTPTLEGILQTLQDNLDAYHHGIPSFLCDERAVSKMAPLLITSPYVASRSQNTVTDSTFRVKRTTNADGYTILTESRDIKSVNGHAAEGEEISGPAIFSGAFSGGPVIVSLSQTACMSYKLRPLRANKPNDPYIVEFASKPANERPDNCVLTEDGAGLVVVDPATMQVTHLEFKVPNHTIFAGGKTANGRDVPPTKGSWVASINYASVVLEGKTFWLTKTLDAKMTGGRGPSVWSFNAKYSNYHKLEVTSRIVPASEGVAP
jgi:hypothetical protein